jgi:Ca2+-binding EF-hand superfamily protein
MSDSPRTQRMMQQAIEASLRDSRPPPPPGGGSMASQVGDLEESVNIARQLLANARNLLAMEPTDQDSQQAVRSAEESYNDAIQLFESSNPLTQNVSARQRTRPASINPLDRLFVMLDDDNSGHLDGNELIDYINGLPYESFYIQRPDLDNVQQAIASFLHGRIAINQSEFPEFIVFLDNALIGVGLREGMLMSYIEFVTQAPVVAGIAMEEGSPPRPTAPVVNAPVVNAPVVNAPVARPTAPVINLNDYRMQPLPGSQFSYVIESQLISRQIRDNARNMLAMDPTDQRSQQLVLTAEESYNDTEYLVSSYRRAYNLFILLNTHDTGILDRNQLFDFVDKLPYERFNIEKPNNIQEVIDTVLNGNLGVTQDEFSEFLNDINDSLVNAGVEQYMLGNYIDIAYRLPPLFGSESSGGRPRKTTKQIKKKQKNKVKQSRKK